MDILKNKLDCLSVDYHSINSGLQRWAAEFKKGHVDCGIDGILPRKSVLPTDNCVTIPWCMT